jgi:hypothetical protein
MAARKGKLAAAEGGGQAAPAAEKIASLLAMLVTKDMDKDAAAIKLDSIGFTAREISGLLDVGSNYVNVAKYRKKTIGGKKARKKG